MVWSKHENNAEVRKLGDGNCSHSTGSLYNDLFVLCYEDLRRIEPLESRMKSEQQGFEKRAGERETSSSSPPILLKSIATYCCDSKILLQATSPFWCEDLRGWVWKGEQSSNLNGHSRTLHRYNKQDASLHQLPSLGDLRRTPYHTSTNSGGE